MTEPKKLNVEKMSKELHLILNLLTNDEQMDQQSFTPIDWNLFIDLAIHHRVYPVLYGKLEKIVEDFGVPEFVLTTLYGLYKRNTFQMLHFSAEMENINQLIAEHQVPTLFLKGPIIGHDLYGDISLRTSSDLDLLIPIENLGEVEKILGSVGYEKDDYIKTVLNDWKWRHHHVTYIHPVKKVKIEVHWRLHPGPAKEPTFHDLWKRRRESCLTNSTIYTLGNEDLLLFLMIHGARHGWSRLRWLLDIHQLMKKEFNWQSIRSLLRIYRYSCIGGQTILLTTRLFETKIPNELKYLLKNKRVLNLAQQAIFYFEMMINLHTEPIPEKVARYHKRYLFSLMSKQQKLLFVTSTLYPYPEDKETLPLPRQLHFLYFPLRPLLWAWRKTKAYTFS